MSADQFALEQLRRDPGMGFEALREVAAREGIPLLPIHYGRARRQVGVPATEAAGEGALEVAAADAGSQDPKPAPAASTAAGPGLKRPSTPAFEFLVEQLRAQPTVSYGELRREAEARGLKLAPIMYGRAKALLGLVPVRPRGQGRARKAQPTPKLDRVRADSPEQFAQQLEAVHGVEDLRAIARQLDLERRRLQTALAQIATCVEDAIS